MINVKKILNYLSYIEIGICAFIIILGSFFPMFHLEAGTIDSDINAWHAIAGVESNSSSGIGKYLEFSFLCLFPFLLLVALIIVNVLYDNKRNVKIDLLRILIICAAILLFVFYMRLVNPGPHFNNYGEIKKFLSQRWGNYLIAVILLFPFVCEIIKLISDIKNNKNK